MKSRQTDQSPKTFAEVLCLLVLSGLTTMLGYSQAAESDYVSPSDANPKGKAPKMRVQLLNPGETTKHYAVIFYHGDEALSGLIEFAEKYQVTSAHFIAIGALSGATLGFFDPQRQMYKKLLIDGQHEVIGMSGDIGLYHEKPALHTHMAVGGGGRNNARRPRSCRVCIPNFGSNGDSRSSNDAKTVRSRNGS